MNTDHSNAIKLTTKAAEYIRAKFLTHLHDTSDVAPPSEWAAHMVWNCNYAASELAKAFRNPSKLNILFERLHIQL